MEHGFRGNEFELEQLRLVFINRIEDLLENTEFMLDLIKWIHINERSVHYLNYMNGID